MASDASEFIEKRRQDRDRRTRAGEDREMMYRAVVRELEEARMGPDREKITSWLAECLIESDEFTAFTVDGDVLDPQAYPLFSVQDAAAIIAKHLHPIGGFNGGGSICVFRDPEDWKWDDLSKSGYRRLWEAAQERRAAAVSEHQEDGK